VKVCFLLIILIMFSPICAQSTPYKKDGVQYATAVASCGNWIENRQKNNAYNLALEGYIAGFLSSYHLYGGTQDLLKGQNLTSAYAYMDKFCSKNPLDFMFIGLIQMIQKVEGDWTEPNVGK